MYPLISSRPSMHSPTSAIACQNVLTEDSPNTLNAALEKFHPCCEIFWLSGVQPDGILLPWQHSLKHYCHNIENFGAPNRLCFSITKLKHITVVKKPWNWSNWFEALKQVLTINSQNDKLAAAWANFSSQGMLCGMCLGKALHNNLDPGNSDNLVNKFSSPDNNGEAGKNLNLDSGNNEDNGFPGPVDGPPIFSEVILTQKQGMPFSCSQRTTDPQPSLEVSTCFIP